eukprot:TRINITY_DN748_c0_g2_i1.p1 TRINITY_DN748_c0_g2~~TRINITY_DN748_c0_g2_i1.p1  ORF type:complete len:440 (-),score=96.53 TRINITY_DN748_c0_g2_i1:85-1404(-)
MKNLKMFVLILLSLVVGFSFAQQDVGIWYWTWQGRASPPRGTTLGIAFNGYVNPADAISNSQPIYDWLPGTKIIALGGGTAPGAWTSGGLNDVISAINGGTFSAYGGIAFDIEAGDSGLGPLFTQAFAAAKANHFIVIVTISHAAPFGIGDGQALMNRFFVDTNIDYISPQLYTSGEETANDYTENMGVTWRDYLTTKAKIIPSITTGALYPDAQTFYSSIGIHITGYIQWQQSGFAGVGPDPPPVPIPTSGTFTCGGTTCSYPSCCSRYGYCGTTDAYCGLGCVAGACSGGSYPPPPQVPPPQVPPPQVPPPQVPPPQVPAPMPVGSTSGTKCTPGSMTCLSSTTYSTCATYTGSPVFGPAQSCSQGTVCQPSGQYIYCVRPSSSTESAESVETSTEPSSTTSVGVAGWAVALLVLCGVILVLVVGLIVLLLKTRTSA